MARQANNTLSYIGLDVRFFDKEKMFLVDERFGDSGMLCALRLILFIAEETGFFLEWNSSTPARIARRFGNITKADELREIVEFLVEIGFFENVGGYLTSQGLFDRWKLTTSNHRRVINFDKIPEILQERFSMKPVSSRNTSPTGINAENSSRNTTPTGINAENSSRNTTPTGITACGNTTKEKKRKEKKSTLVCDSCTLDSSARASAPTHTHEAESFDFHPEPEPEFDPVTEVVKEWNEVCAGTPLAYRHHYPDAMLSHNIRERWKTDTDLKTYRKVFEVAKDEATGRSRDRFAWTLWSVFGKPNTFDQLLAKSTLPPPPAKRGDKRGDQGYSDPSRYASAEEWKNFGLKLAGGSR
jgi:hypothetical protein